jgi:hypothetical protein
MSRYTAEQMRQYQNSRRSRLRAELIAELGGACSWCGSAEDLQFDHIEPGTKLFTIASGLDKPRTILFAEIAKCQLLCVTHHKEKTREDGSILSGEKTRQAKLTEKQVMEIIGSSLPATRLARRYNVSPQAIYFIRWGQTWKHLARVA